MQLGNKIQEQRKKINMTQEKLAAEMGVSETAISKWENENSMPPGWDFSGYSYAGYGRD